MNTTMINKTKIAIGASLLAAGALIGTSAQAADLPGYSATYAEKADGRTGTATRTLTK